MKSDRQAADLTLEQLDERLKILLPADYQDCYEKIEPVSMGSAGLKYGRDGKVAWDDMWGSFCDLAMAGGPPHKGKLLEPGSEGEIAAHPERYEEVVKEIRRGIQLVTYLPAKASGTAGWIKVDCGYPTKAEWLARAIAMENISTYCNGPILSLPAGPGYRIEKEIKNVITAIAKTAHYWDGHMPLTQQTRIRELFTQMQTESPFVQPAVMGAISVADCENATEALRATLPEATGLSPSEQRYFGWLGLECGDVGIAVWMMRALVALNVLSRREETTLFVPVNPATGAVQAVSDCVAAVRRLAEARGISR